MKELYINGQRADITAKFSITIESNALGDISKIRSNHTSTMRLPRSVANERIFGFAGVPSMDSTMVRKWFSCTYIVDGVAVIQDGKAYLLSAAEDYEISVVWGVRGTLQAMLEEGLKLWQLPGNHTIQLQQNPNPSTKGYNYGWAEYQSGFDGDTVTPSRLPVVSAEWVWNEIFTKYNITETMPVNAATRLSQLLIPLTTMKRYVEDANHSGQAFTVRFYWSQMYQHYFWNTGDTVNGLLTGACFAFGMSGPQGAGARVKVVFHVEGITYDTPSEIQPWSGQWQGQDIPVPEISYEGGVWIIDMEKGDVFTVEPRSGFNPADGDLVTLTGWYESDADMHVGDYYPIIANLPDMTCVDFIKEICAQLGIFPVNTSQGWGNTLVFTNIETMEVAADQSVEVLKVRNVSWRHGTLAQRNVMKYATDDFMINNFQGAIEVTDETLAATADMWTSKFAGIYGNSVPLYTTETVEEDDGNGNITVTVTAKLNKLAPRIAREVGTGTTSRVGFTSMPWSSIITSFYDGWQRLIRKPLAVEAELLMRPWELKALQSDRLLWSEHLGVHLLMLSAQGDEGDIVRVKALKLKS